MKSKRIALFHPWIKSRGGAEKVVLEILKNSKHKIDLYTWIFDKENTFSEFQKYKINVIAPSFGKKMSRFYLLRGLFFPISLLKKIPIKNYDKLLISTSGVGEFVVFRSQKKGKTYAYVHTPLREASKKIVKWNIKNRHKGLKKYVYLSSVWFYRILEKAAWKKIDSVIFNSKLSLSRAKESNLLKKQDVRIINPPVDFSRFENLKSVKGNSFIYISRLNPPKRQDVLIAAWKKFSKKYPEFKLILAGTPENKVYFN